MGPERGASNVVLITIDSLRADAIGAYDEDRHTPVMDGIAERGTVFESAFANGNWTPFSFPSMLASRPVFADSDRVGISDSPSLASVLSEAGIATAGFNAANGFLTSQWGYDEGFEEFEPFVASVGSSIYSRYLATHPTVEAWLQLAASPFRRLGSWFRRETDDRPFLDTSRMFDVEHAARSFIEDTEEPFFLWIHYMDAHTPYVPAPRYIRDVSSDFFGTHRMFQAHVRTGLGWEVGDRTLNDLRTLYQAAVRQIDASVGRIMETLAETGVTEETAVMLAGDHGEEFQDHGHLAHYPKLYDELIRVPLIVDAPDAPVRRIDRQVGLDAIPPTVADLLSVDAPPAWEGQSLVPTVLDGEQPADEPIVSITVRGEEVTSQPIPRSLDDGDLLVSVRDREWTYIENVETGATELYHRPSDPGEQEDRSDDPGKEGQRLVERFGEIVDDHASRIRERTAEAGGSDDGKDADVDEDLQTRLEALGYR